MSRCPTRRRSSTSRGGRTWPPGCRSPPAASRVVVADPDRLVSNPDFLRVWLGQVASSFGQGVSLIATPLLVLALTSSPLAAGIVAAGRSAPYLGLGLPAGALVDRWDRRALLVACELARGLAVASVPVAWWLGVLGVGQLVAVALLQGVSVTFSNVAQTAALPRLVRREQIAAAQALNTSSLGVATLVGPGLGGLVVGLGSTTVEGAAFAFALDACTAVVATTLLLLTRRPFQERAQPFWGAGLRRSPAGSPAGSRLERHMRREIAEGLRYLWNDRPIRLLAVVNMVHRVCLGSVVVLPVVVFGRAVLGADPAALGLVVGAAGAGGLLGSAVTPPIRRRLPVGWHMVGVVALHGLGIGLVGLAPSVVLAMAGMVVVGAAEAMTSIVQVSYRLATIPDALQGRVNSVYRMGSFAAMTVGTPAVGYLVEALGPRPALWAMSAYVLVVALGTARSGVRRL